MSHGFADTYLHFATFIALAPAVMVAIGLAGARSGLLSHQVGVDLMALEWAPRIALTSVVAGLFGVAVALLSGFRRFWLRALVAVAITTATLFGYVWDRDVRRPAADPAAIPISAAR